MYYAEHFGLQSEEPAFLMIVHLLVVENLVTRMSYYETR